MSTLSLTPFAEFAGRFRPDSYYLIRQAMTGLSAVAPGVAARALHALYRRPALTRRYELCERALLREAGELQKSAIVLDTQICPKRRMRSYLYRTEAKTSRGLVLLIHGWTADSRAMTAFIEPLTEAGYDAIAVDLPAHGASGGWTTCVESAAAAVRTMLEAENLSPDHIIAHSFGGAVATMLSAHGVIPKSATFLATPSAMAAALTELAEAFGLSKTALERFMELNSRLSTRPLDEYDARRIWRNRATKLLIMHGPDDDSVPFTHARRLQGLANVRLAPAAGVTHRGIVHHQASTASALAHIIAADEAG